MSARRSSLQRLRESFDVDILYAFGSRAGEVRDWPAGETPLAPGPSDVDIGVTPASGDHLSVHDKVRLAIAPEDLFGVHPVDLVLPDEADEYGIYILRRAGDGALLERERLASIFGEEPTRRAVGDRPPGLSECAGDLCPAPANERGLPCRPAVGQIGRLDGLCNPSKDL